MLEVLPFVEDPDLSGSAAPALPQLLPPCNLNLFITPCCKKLSSVFTPWILHNNLVSLNFKCKKGEDLSTWVHSTCNFHWPDLHALKCHDSIYHGGPGPKWSLFFIVHNIIFWFLLCGEDPRYADMHLVQTFCSTSLSCCNKMLKIVKIEKLTCPRTPSQK